MQWAYGSQHLGTTNKMKRDSDAAQWATHYKLSVSLTSPNVHIPIFFKFNGAMSIWVNIGVAQRGSGVDVQHGESFQWRQPLVDSYSGFSVERHFVGEEGSSGYNDVGRWISPLLDLSSGDVSHVGMALDYVASIRFAAQRGVQDGVGREVQQL